MTIDTRILDDLDFEPPPDDLYEPEPVDYEPTPPVDITEGLLAPDLGDIPSTLTAEQRQVVEALEGHVMVVAGPGSGKTRVLIERIIHAIRTGTPAGRILAVTFTRKAASEVKERLVASLGEELAKQVTATTFHGFSAALVRQEGHRIGVARDYEVMDGSEQSRIIRALSKQYDIQPDPMNHLREISLSRRQLDLETDGQRAAWLRSNKMHNAAALLPAYVKEKQRLGRLDFDDLVGFAYQLLQTDDVRTRWASRFDHVLVDEVQDSDALQHAMVSAIASRATSLMLVGDLDQSIYSWRGAVPALFRDYQRDHPGTRVITLQDNFRSTPEILSVVRATISEIPWAHRSALRANKPSGAEPRIVQAFDHKAEAKAVVAWVRDLLQRGTNPGEIAILFRGRRQSLATQSALTRGRIDYRMTGGQNFYESKAVKDVLAWFRLAFKPTDELAFYRAVSQLPGLGEKRAGEFVSSAATEMDGDILAWCRSFVHQQSTSNRKLPKYVNVLEALLDQVDSVRRTAETRGLGEAMRVASLCVPSEVRAKDEITDSDVTAMEEQLIGDANAFAPTEPLPLEQGLEVRHPVHGYGIVMDLDNPAEVVVGYDHGEETYPSDALRQVVCRDSSSLVPPPIEFLQTITIDNQELEETKGPVVELSTIHAAKGREFDHVWVLGLNDGSFPASGTEHPALPLLLPSDEDRRLMFVAASRARQELVLSCFTMRQFNNGGTVRANPSVFLYELQEAAVCQQDKPLPRPQSKQSGFGVW